MMFDFCLQNNQKWLVFINVHVLSNRLDIKSYLLSQFIQRKQENNSSNSIFTEYSVFDWMLVIFPLILKTKFLQ